MHLDFPVRTVRAGALAGTDPRNGVAGQGHDHEALAIELGPAAGKIEVQIVKAMRLAMGRQVIDVDRFDMEEETRLHIRGAARGFAVNERACASIHVKLGAGDRSGGLDGAERRFVGRAERKSRFPELGIRADALAGADTRDGIGGQGREREALMIEMHAAAGPIEIQIIKTVRPAMGRQVIAVDGHDMEEEARLHLRGVAHGFAVNERTCAGMHVERGTGDRSGGLDGAERRLIGRAERKSRFPDPPPADELAYRSI